MNDLAGQTALVTGGTAGIGLESARLLARHGAEVIITGRSEQRGAAAVAELGGGVRFVAADLSDLDSVRSLVRQCGDGVDIVVNNAASFPGALTVEQDVASFESTFDTNVRGAYFLVAALAPGMLRRGRGSIVNVTSMVAFKGFPVRRATALPKPRWVADSYVGRGIRPTRGTGQQRCAGTDRHRRSRRRMGRRQ